MSQQIFSYKMVLFGNVAVGKTSLVEQFINQRFEKDYVSTLGYNVYEKRMTFLNFSITLMIFDVGGQEKFRDLRHKYAKGAKTAFLVYDITDFDSFTSIKMWKNELYHIAGRIPFIIIGNKADLQAKRQVPLSEAVKVGTALGALNVFETSAKTGDGVEDAFKLLAIKTYEHYVR